MEGKMKKKTAILLVILAVLSLAVCACTKDGGTETTKPTEMNTTGTTSVSNQTSSSDKQSETSKGTTTTTLIDLSENSELVTWLNFGLRLDKENISAQKFTDFENGIEQIAFKYDNEQMTFRCSETASGTALSGLSVSENDRRLEAVTISDDETVVYTFYRYNDNSICVEWTEVLKTVFGTKTIHCSLYSEKNLDLSIMTSIIMNIVDVH